MKILAIRGKNIASLDGEFSVDFTCDPLFSAGLFAITGPTGAGKSTLLDVLCLALFDKTPRMNRARENGVLRPDVQDKTLSQNDCRSLLRRGTAEGYAEVDFLAVDGENYRARWSVRRARNRVDGSLQPSEIRLYNLSSGDEEQGGKGELLRCISDLLGLSFEQFTRAVLLAQGDFATFLKAPEEEKADLLEKLTGTEIYSRISQAVFAHAKEVRERYEEIVRQKGALSTLSEEERKGLVEERVSRQTLSEETGKRCDVLKMQLRWIEEYRRLSGLSKEAETEWQVARKNFVEAQSRREYMAQYDLVQEVRDIYNEVRSLLEKKKKMEETLDRCRNEYRNKNQELLRLEKIKDEAEQNLSRLKENWERQAGDRQRAFALDTQSAVSKEALDYAAKVHDRNKEDLGREISQKNKIYESIEKNRSKEAEIIQWFEHQQIYSPIVDRAEIIKQNYSEWMNIRKELKQQQESQKRQVALIAETEAKIASLQLEGQRLEALAPAEVYMLRASLVEGEPCPVCGSIHHTYTAEKVETLRYKELEMQKKDVADNLKETSLYLDNLKITVHTMQMLVETLSRQEAGKKESLDSDLREFLPNWEEESRLGERIQKFAVLWNERKEELSRLKSDTEAARRMLPAIEAKIKDLEILERNSALSLEKEREKYEKIKAERACLFGGRSLKDIEGEYELALKAGEAGTAETIRQYTGLISLRENLLGSVAQLQQNLAAGQRDISRGQKIIADWLLAHSDLSEERLSELLTHTLAWVADEKKALSSLQENMAAADTRLRERSEALNRHEHLTERPEQLDSIFLRQQLDDSDLLQKKADDRIAEINALLALDDRNRKELLSLERQGEKLFEKVESWARLNELLGSADGAKFRRIAQGYTLDRLLIYANLHLQELSSRYVLQRVPERLALQVCDNDMLGEVRSVHTLSGGESFLISLALALGLSSLSSYRMNIESLFIDEGFGSLDAETLGVAMDALEHLQIQGRKIGVISHVAEMTERIPVQVQVRRVANGRSRITVVEV